jgi:hypothetical protein
MTISPALLRHVDVATAADLPAFAFPGGYPVLYIVENGQSIVCADCAKKIGSDPDDEMVTAIDIFYEGPPAFCDECNAEIASAYGDPDAPEALETNDRTMN